MKTRFVWSVIAAVDRGLVIGIDGKRMPWHIPEDLKHFKQVTYGKPVIMGRKTYESIGKPLPGRFNVVITRDKKYSPDPKVRVVHSYAEAQEAAMKWWQEQEALPPYETFIIGGSDVYAQAIHGANRAYITRIDGEFAGNRYFPGSINNADTWREVDRREQSTPGINGIHYSFCLYERRAP